MDGRGGGDRNRRPLADTVQMSERLSATQRILPKTLKNAKRIFQHFPIVSPTAVYKCRQFSVLRFARGSLGSY